MTAALGPSLELQGAYVAALTADADVKALIGVTPRINPPQSDPNAWPGSYVGIGEGQVVPDLAECIDGSEVFTDVHVWSRADRTFADCKKIVATCWRAISAASLVLTENRLLALDRESERYLRDPDGKTLHAVLTIRALTEPA